MSGPNDTQARIRAITRTLEESLGTGGWNYLVEVPSGRCGPYGTALADQFAEDR
jgi:hypothetical protein